MSDYPLNCTWEEVEHAALHPNIHITMSKRNDPDIGEITVLSKTGAEIYALLQNPNNNLVFTDLQGRNCTLSTPPASSSGDLVLSVIDDTTMYIYSVPDGYGRVYTTTQGVAANAVMYTTQSLTPNEQAIARGNIDALGAGDPAGVLSLSVSGTTVTLNAGASYVMEILASQGKTFFVGGTLLFIPVAADTVNLTLTLASVSAGVLYVATLAPLSSTYMQGTLTAYTLAADAVLYSAQTLTTAQQAQARTNIGALGASDIGTVFTLKGSVANVASLPSSGNAVGDVYYVESVSAGYIWLTNTTYPNGYWEELGETVDLSAYQEKPTVVTVTGNTPTIALAENNKIYKCTGTAITAVTITAIDTNAEFAVIFDSPAAASPASFVYPTNAIKLPYGFNFEANRHYEINVDGEGYALAGAWELTT